MTPRMRAIATALLSAALFGASTPLAKLLIGAMDPWLLAGILYLGAGIGLTIYRLLRGSPRLALAPGDTRWLAGAVILGGMLGPALLMLGLSRMSASSAALLLNAEGVLTALIAWFIFRENFDARIALGMAAIVGGAVVLAMPASAEGGGSGWAPLLIVGACLCWAIDNNLTRRVSLADPVAIAAIKGLVAGPVNLTLALFAGASLPGWAPTLAAGALGLLGYGVSLTLFVVALRELGTARTSAYFSTAPFMGALLAMGLLGEPLTLRLIVAGLLMGVGTWLHLSERHDHEHQHRPLEHSHEHVHDEHHQHEHEHDEPVGEPHVHAHRHEPLTHAHPHHPDAHHRHEH